MRWVFTNGWYYATASGLVSWKFQSPKEAIEWAFITKEARRAAEELEVIK